MLELTKARKTFFETFGYLHFSGLLIDRIERITQEYDRIWSGETGHRFSDKMFDRRVLPGFIDRSEYLCSLLDDQRVEGICGGLLGADFNYISSEGNRYGGDSAWHTDDWSASPAMSYPKIVIYLESLRRDTGALRVIPGSHRKGEPWADLLHSHDIRFGSTLETAFGVDDRDMPCAVLETDPGDVIVFDQKIKHATFGGGKRRMFWMIFGARCHDEEDFAKLRGNIHNYAEYGLERIFSQRMISTAGPRRMVHLEQAWANDGELARRSAARTPAAGPGS